MCSRITSPLEITGLNMHNQRQQIRPPATVMLCAKTAPFTSGVFAGRYVFLEGS